MPDLITIIEDDESIREMLRYYFHSVGYGVEDFESGEDYFQAVHDVQPDLYILDIMLPDEDGLTILRKLRETAQTAKLPVIMLTAKGTEYDKVVGLDSGADDYIPKPFGMMELVSRVRALLRRTEPEQRADTCDAGPIHVDLNRHMVTVDGNAVTLTFKEFELLCYLMENKGMVLTRDQLLSKIWGYDFDGETRTVDVHIRTLRQKLGEASRCIETIRGVGYKLEESET